jgi:hypothetical protein
VRTSEVRLLARNSANATQNRLSTTCRSSALSCTTFCSFSLSSNYLFTTNFSFQNHHIHSLIVNSKSNIYAPHTFNDALAMSLVLTAVHVLLELPHLGYENRSYTALIVHTGYHFLQTLLPLLVIQNFFAFPRLPSLKI